jgi:hypothetical protein
LIAAADVEVHKAATIKGRIWRDIVSSPLKLRELIRLTLRLYIAKMDAGNGLGLWKQKSLR